MGTVHIGHFPKRSRRQIQTIQKRSFRFVDGACTISLVANSRNQTLAVHIVLCRGNQLVVLESLFQGTDGRPPIRQNAERHYTDLALWLTKNERIRTTMAQLRTELNKKQTQVHDSS